eukprot:1137186-Pelagomonas_calceolata.AAC.3
MGDNVSPLIVPFSTVICLVLPPEGNLIWVLAFSVIFDRVNGISREAKVIHNSKHPVMKSGIKSRSEVYDKGTDVFPKRFQIFKPHDDILELVDCVCLVTEPSLSGTQ